MSQTDHICKKRKLNEYLDSDFSDEYLSEFNSESELEELEEQELEEQELEEQEPEEQEPESDKLQALFNKAVNDVLFKDKRKVNF